MNLIGLSEDSPYVACEHKQKGKKISLHSIRLVLQASDHLVFELLRDVLASE